MPVTINDSTLTAKEIAAIERVIPDPPPAAEGEPQKERETVAQFLARVGAGQNDIDNYVAAMTADFNAKLAAASEALLDAGIDPAQIVALAQGFAAATPQQRGQVIALLMPGQ